MPMIKWQMFPPHHPKSPENHTSLYGLIIYLRRLEFGTGQIVPRSCRFCRLLNNRPALAFFNCSKGPMYGRHGAKRITLVENQLSSVILTDTGSWCREPSVQCIYQNILLKKLYFLFENVLLKLHTFACKVVVAVKVMLLYTFWRGGGRTGGPCSVTTTCWATFWHQVCHGAVLQLEWLGRNRMFQRQVLNSEHHSKYTKLVAWMFLYTKLVHECRTLPNVYRNSCSSFSQTIPKSLVPRHQRQPAFEAQMMVSGEVCVIVLIHGNCG